jgi:very-short-patch-repair endonuclease
VDNAPQPLLIGEAGRMEVQEALDFVGGVGTAGELFALTSRRKVRTALASGELVRIMRGRYGRPETNARATAARLGGVLSHLSAALHWGWAVKRPPTMTQIVVPRGRNVDAARRHGVDLRWAVLDAGDHAGVATTPVRTVIDCARLLPFDEALVVADSALRSRLVTREQLLAAAASSPRTGRRRVLDVIGFADPRAANAFESVLRAIVREVAGAQFEPQLTIGTLGRPDLVDVEHRLILEADSFAFHSDAEALVRDIERYNGFVIEGWTVLRFGWRHVMEQPDYVLACVRAALAVAN